MFAGKWVASLGKSRDRMTKGAAARAYLMSLMAYLVMAYVLDQFIYATLSWTAMKGLKIGLAAGMGFAVTTSLASAIFEGKPFELYAINAGYNLVCLAVMGAIIGGWQ